jgi:hypothetical protein
MSLARLAAAYCGGIPRGGGRPALQRRHQSRRSRNRPTLESTISREVARKAGQAQVTLGFDLAVSVFRDALSGRRALTRDRRREAPGLPSRGTRNGGGPAYGGCHTRYRCIAGS